MLGISEGIASHEVGSGLGNPPIDWQMRLLPLLDDF